MIFETPALVELATLAHPYQNGVSGFNRFFSVEICERVFRGAFLAADGKNFQFQLQLFLLKLNKLKLLIKGIEEDDVPSVAIGDEETGGTVADLDLEDLVDCLVDGLNITGLFCSSKSRSS